MTYPIEWEQMLEKDATKRTMFGQAYLQKEKMKTKPVSGTTTSGTPYGPNRELDELANAYLGKRGVKSKRS